MAELIPASYQCACCGGTNDALIDPSGGNHQTYIEDCTVCCRPNVLHVSISSNGEAAIQASDEE